MGRKEKDSPVEDFAGPVLCKGLSMQCASWAAGQEQERQKRWGMAQICMIRGEKNAWGSSFGNEIPKGLAVPLPALGV